MSDSQQCPPGRLDLKEENNEPNITWMVIRENLSGEDIGSKVHSVLSLILPSTKQVPTLVNGTRKYRPENMSSTVTCTVCKEYGLRCKFTQCISYIIVNLDEPLGQQQ